MPPPAGPRSARAGSHPHPDHPAPGTPPPRGRPPLVPRAVLPAPAGPHVPPLLQRHFHPAPDVVAELLGLLAGAPNRREEDVHAEGFVRGVPDLADCLPHLA